MMRKTYQLKKHFSIIAHDNNCVELRSGVWNPISYTIRDNSHTNTLFRLLNAMDGTLTAEEIAEEENVKTKDVEELLNHLQKLDVIEEGNSSMIDYYVDYFSPHFKQQQKNKPPLTNILVIGDDWMTRDLTSSLSDSLINTHIRQVHVEDECLQQLHHSDDSWLHDALALEKVLAKFQHWKDHFIVVALSRVDPVFCCRLNRICHELNIPWLHGAIDGPFILVGPTFTGKSSPCFQCFETRVYMNLREQSSYQRYKNALARGVVSLMVAETWCTPIKQTLTAHLNLEAINYALTRTNFTKHKLLSFYLPTMEISFNEVLKESSCHVCGTIQHRDNQQLYFDYQTLMQEV